MPTKPSYQTVTEAEYRARLSCIRLCSRAPQVFELTTAPHPVTILSQQLRALRLADALSMFYERGEPVSVAVVGGGVSGLTFAAAMMSLTPSASITVYEESDPFWRFKKSSRYVHPNVYDWPAPGSSNRFAPLPVFGWEAGEAQHVVDHWLKELDHFKSGGLAIEKEAIHDVDSPDSKEPLGDKRTQVFLNGDSTKRYDIVVVATGFPSVGESFVDKYWPTDSKPDWIDCPKDWDYWHDATRQLYGDPSKYEKVVFVGGGDSAIIEALDIVYGSAWYKAGIERALKMPSSFQIPILKDSYFSARPETAMTPRPEEKAALKSLFTAEPSGVRVAVYAGDGFKHAARLNGLFSELASELSGGHYSWQTLRVESIDDLPAEYRKPTAPASKKRLALIDRSGRRGASPVSIDRDEGQRKNRGNHLDIESARRFRTAQEFSFAETHSETFETEKAAI